MHTTRLVFTVIIALVLTGCPAPIGSQNGDSKNYPFFTDAEFVSAGREHVLILKSDKTLWAVGDNQYGQLGDQTTTDQTVPIKVMDGVETMEAGSFHTMIVKTDKTLWAVGDNQYGQLGNDSTDTQLVPVKILDSVRQVSASTGHTMVVKTDDTLWGFGRNHFGQIGNGATTEIPPKKSRNPPKIKAGSTTLVTTPTQVLIVQGNPNSALDNVDQVAARAGVHTMVLTKDNKLWGFGRNNVGQLGYDKPDNLGKPSPVNISKSPGNIPNENKQPMDDVKQVSAAFTYTMLVKNDDSLHFIGILGLEGRKPPDGLKDVQDRWEKIAENVEKVSTGSRHAMIISKTDNTLWAIGENTYGQLGDGTTEDSVTPVKIMKGVKDVYAGYRYTYFIKTDGSLWAMGLNDKGQLGDGTTTNRLKPVQVKMNAK